MLFRSIKLYNLKGDEIIMQLNQKRFLSVLLCAAMTLGILSGCQKEPGPSSSSGSQSGSSSSTTQTPDGDKTQVNFTVLSGPTGVGAAKLISDDEQGLTLNDYHVTITAANDEVTALLASGETDIAAIATNVGANLYNKTDGAVQMLAVNTLGVLYLLDKGGDVNTLEDLRGKTIWAAGQGANPEYILNKLLNEAGLTPGQDVTIEWLTAQEIMANMIQSEGGVCMLPVPAATTLLQKVPDVREALSVTKLWQELVGTPLPMGCIVARTAFIEENPQAVADFLQEYQASIDYMVNPENIATPDGLGADALLVKYDIVPTLEIAAQAIDQCNLIFITGDDMQRVVQGYYEILFQANPDSIGGGMPYDDFYYQP